MHSLTHRLGASYLPWTHSGASTFLLHLHLLSQARGLLRPVKEFKECPKFGIEVSGFIHLHNPDLLRLKNFVIFELITFQELRSERVGLKSYFF